MPTLWFSYSDLNGLDGPEPINSPYTITWHLGRYLRSHVTERGYDFRYVNLDDCGDYTIGADDVVIGHTWYPEGFITKAFEQPCRARFILQPYQHDIVGKNESWWIKALADKADHLFFVTGPYWWDTMSKGLYGDWKEKATRLDMAINPALHPLTKTRWNPPGKRSFLAIGADIPYKGLSMIADLARIGGLRLGYYGNAPYERFQHVPQMTHYGGRAFTPDVTAEITAEYDFFVSLAIGDACPTTLLETSCWGMLPFCNDQSGYWPNHPFMELRKDNMQFNLEQIDYIQRAPEYELRDRADKIRQHVIKRHGWDLFCDTIWEKLTEWL